MPHYDLPALRRVIAADEPLSRLTASFKDKLPDIQEIQKRRITQFKYQTVGEFSYDIKRRAAVLAECQKPLYQITVKANAEKPLSFKVTQNDQKEYVLSTDDFVPCEDSKSVLVEGDKMAASVCEDYFSAEMFASILQVLSKQHHVPEIFISYLASIQINQQYHLSHWFIPALKKLLQPAIPIFSAEQSETPGEGQKTKISSMLSKLTTEPYCVEIDLPAKTMTVSFCGTAVTVNGAKKVTDLDLDQLKPEDQHLDLSEDTIAQYVKDGILTEIDGQLFQTKFWPSLAEEARYKLIDRNRNVGNNNDQRLTVNDLRALFLSIKNNERLASMITHDHQYYAFFLLEQEEPECKLILRKFLQDIFIGNPENLPEVPKEFIESITTIFSETYDTVDYTKEQEQEWAVSLGVAAAQEDDFVLVRALGRSQSCPALFFRTTSSAQRETTHGAKDNAGLADGAEDAGLADTICYNPSFRME